MKKIILSFAFIILMTIVVYAEGKNCFYEKNGNTYFYDSNGSTAKDRWILVNDTPYFADENGVILKNTFTPDVVYVDQDGKYKYNHYIDISLQDLNKSYTYDTILKELIENKSHGCLVLKSIDTRRIETGFKDKQVLADLVSNTDIEINKIIDKELTPVKKNLEQYRSVWIIIRYYGKTKNDYNAYISFTISKKGELHKPSNKYYINYDINKEKLVVKEPETSRRYVYVYPKLYYCDNLYYYKKNDILSKNESVKIKNRTYKFNKNGELVKDEFIGKLFEFDDAKYYIKYDGHYANNEWVNIDGKDTGFNFDSTMLINRPDNNRIYLADSEGHKVYSNWVIVDSKNEYHDVYFADNNGYLRIYLSFHEKEMNEDEMCHFCKKNTKCAVLEYHHDFTKDKNIEKKIEYKSDNYNICLSCCNQQKYKDLITEFKIK